MDQYYVELIGHYQSVWGPDYNGLHAKGGRSGELPAVFFVLEFPPTIGRGVWVYATIGMSIQRDEVPIEVHLFSPRKHAEHVDTLAAIAHYHRTGTSLGPNHTVNLGRPWMPLSRCDCALISPPFPDGKAMTTIEGRDHSQETQLLWMMPITQAEREYAKAHGIEEFWTRFDQNPVSYVDVQRESVV
jgi:hypothetical protein